MSLFRGSGRLEQKLAQNNDPMKQKKLWVKSALESLPGVTAEVSLAKNTAALTMTEPHSPEELTAAVEAAGYKVTRIE